MGPGGDLRRGAACRDRGSERSGRRRDGPGPRRPRHRQVADPLGLVDEYLLATVPIAIGAGHSPFAELDEHLKLDVVEGERFRAGSSRRSWCRSDERQPKLNRAKDCEDPAICAPGLLRRFRAASRRTAVRRRRSRASGLVGDLLVKARSEFDVAHQSCGHEVLRAEGRHRGIDPQLLEKLRRAIALGLEALDQVLALGEPEVLRGLRRPLQGLSPSTSGSECSGTNPVRRDLEPQSATPPHKQVPCSA